MEKEYKYPLVGAGVGMCFGFLLDLWLQYLNKEDDTPFWNNVDWQSTAKSSILFGSVGALAGYGYYRMKVGEGIEEPFFSSAFLFQKLNSESIKKDSRLYTKGVSIRNEIKDHLVAKFGENLIAQPINWGSSAKGTGNFSSDWDVVLAFKKSIGSLENMYENVYEVLVEKYDGKFEIRKQKRSIGITYNLQDEELHFDIVPGREINDFKIDGELNLLERPNTFWESPTRIKTNVTIHKQLTVNRPHERRVIRLLKIYRDEKNLPLKSTAIENLVLEAFDKKPPTNSIKENFLYAMNYLSNKITYARIVDPANSNNILSSDISENDKSRIADELANDLEDIKKDERHFMKAFNI